MSQTNKEKKRQAKQRARKNKFSSRNLAVNSAVRFATKSCKSIEQYKNDVNRIKGEILKFHRANSRLYHLIKNIDDEKLNQEFIRAQMTLRKWIGKSGLISKKEFNCIATSIMHGLLVLEILDVENSSQYRHELQDASFRLFQCLMLSSNDEVLTEADLTAVADGLDLSQELMRVCFDTDVEKYRTVIMQNETFYVDAHPELLDKRHKLALGRNAHIVEDWFRNDKIKVKL